MTFHRWSMVAVLGIVGAGLMGFYRAPGQQADAVPRNPTRTEQAWVTEPLDADVIWRNRTAWSGWRWVDSFGRFAGSVRVFDGYVRDGARDAAARHVFIARQIERRFGEVDIVRWTDSEACPLLADRLRAFEAITAPQLRVDMDREPPPRVVADGVSWTLWSNLALQQNRARAQVSMSSNDGAILEWGLETRAALDTCWTGTEPPQPIS